MPYQRGEVVYVPFQYSELSGGKVRPAIVVNSAEFQAVEQLYIVAAVTSNVTASSLGHRIVDATSAGLKIAQPGASYLADLEPASDGRKCRSVIARRHAAS